MRQRPTAVGYLRRDVSGVVQTWDEIRIRGLAKRFGYDLAKTVVFGSVTDHPVTRLINVVRSLDAEAVVVPGLGHFEGEVPGRLVSVADLITVKPENTYARWAFEQLTQPPSGI
ncbi:hypothetical protein GV794_03795 [Nocardia cyriacigeorgica]|uniref:Uncharacterized protein n=1 Tax=Nocardia cyriacigeorgica TaxID=135487 RepID=A0A6P1CZM0_9NOCA|nr:hypothetical protein [Nocardia cyriacigeorgica]NEW40334.1 hypothetical protein [Nocardia cyriacigeorgica]NEW43467.1 hypothetical protein [Nocardia cyriacigeorgica]NEW50718.1 hypothetical protein [Nocardia cyriacigeorgica]NEW54794.1 hypothetical protein [Nocardia cyriacigeorgica]